VTTSLRSVLKVPVNVNSRFYSQSGKIRLAHVRNEVYQKWISHDELIEVYQEWRDTTEYIVLAKPESRKFRAVKCAKRGNDVYKWRIDNRFEELDALAEIIGDDKIFDINQDNPETNVLFLTLTYDTKLCSDGRAWDNIGIEWNRYLAWLEKKYGRVSFLRAWEGFRNGYPHIHAVVVFEEHQFPVFEQKVTDNKTVYRVEDKKELEGNWHSFVDVVAVNSVGGALRYLTKYLRKTHGRGSGTNLTQAQMWIHRKQSYSMSGDFMERLRLVYKTLHNSNTKPVQINLDVDSIEEK